MGLSYPGMAVDCPGKSLGVADSKYEFNREQDARTRQDNWLAKSVSVSLTTRASNSYLNSATPTKTDTRLLKDKFRVP